MSYRDSTGRRWYGEGTTPTERTLLDASDLIEDRGWTRKRMESADGCLCAIGALRIACHGTTEGHSYAEDVGNAPSGSPRWCQRTQSIFATWLAEEAVSGGAAFTYVHEWNDNRADGAQEVIDNLRYAATCEADIRKTVLP